MIVNSENDDKNTKPGPDRSGEPESGPEENSELDWAKQHVIDEPVPAKQDPGQNSTVAGKGWRAKDPTTAPLQFERVTALRGQSIPRPREPKSVRRRQTRADLNVKDPEIPYVKFETATRDIICALMERQDRMNEEIFCKINDIAYRVGDLEQDRTLGGNGK